MIFVHRVTTYGSTKLKRIPFELLYNRKAVLPIYIKHNTKDLSNLDETFDKDVFATVLESATSFRNQIHYNVEHNIKKAQEEQQHEHSTCEK